MIQLDDLQRGDRIEILCDKPPQRLTGEFVRIEKMFGRWWVSIDEGHTISPGFAALTSICTRSITRIKRFQPARAR